MTTTHQEDLPGTRPGAGEVVVVIDVIRAFTTAAILLYRAATRIICVQDSSQAARAAREPASVSRGPLIVGEQLNPPNSDVDLPNSPLAATKADVQGRPVILYTINGTRALADIPAGSTVLCAAIVNLNATAEWILTNRPGATVRFVITGPATPEDQICADLLTARLAGRPVDGAWTRSAIRAAGDAHARLWADKVPPHVWTQFVADVDICADVDSFPVVLLSSRDRHNRHVLRPGPRS